MTAATVQVVGQLVAVMRASMGPIRTQILAGTRMAIIASVVMVAKIQAVRSPRVKTSITITIASAAISGVIRRMKRVPRTRIRTMMVLMMVLPVIATIRQSSHLREA